MHKNMCFTLSVTTCATQIPVAVSPVSGLAKGPLSGARVGAHLSPPYPQEVVGLGDEGGRDSAGEAPCGAVGDVRTVPAPSHAEGNVGGRPTKGRNTRKSLTCVCRLPPWPR